MARPPSFKPEYCEQAKKLCEFGATDIELADFFKVSDRTIYRWQAQYPEFCQALKAGKEHADERVERSLFHKAVGYTHDAVKIFMPANAAAPVYAPYREHVAPDTTAAIFWLKNRRPQAWRDVQRIEHAGDSKEHELTDQQLADIARKSGNGTAAPTNGAGKPDSVRKLN